MRSFLLPVDQRYESKKLDSRSHVNALPGWEDFTALSQFTNAPAVAVQAADLSPHSHVRIVRTVTALRSCPDNVLARVLDIACLAVHAVSGIDLKPRFVIFLRTAKDFIDTGGAVPLRGFRVFRQIDSNRNVLVTELQMARLIPLRGWSRKSSRSSNGRS